MCIIHDLSLHYIYQDIMEAFEQSRMLSHAFMLRIAPLLCTCKHEIYSSPNSIISTLRSLYQWFDEASTCSLPSTSASNHDHNDSSVTESRLRHFRAVVCELRDNGRVDTGTKIEFLTLLRDLEEGHLSARFRRRTHFASRVLLVKFDPKLCSAKEFIQQMQRIDNGRAIKSIENAHQCRVILRDYNHLALRNHFGLCDVTIQMRGAYDSGSMARAVVAIERLAYSVTYRQREQLPHDDMYQDGGIELIKQQLHIDNSSSKTKPAMSMNDLKSVLDSILPNRKSSEVTVAKPPLLAMLSKPQPFCLSKSFDTVMKEVNTPRPHHEHYHKRIIEC